MIHVSMHTYKDLVANAVDLVLAVQTIDLFSGLTYGQFSTFQICFCGLDPGNLKFETVQTHKQHICF